ncbi:MAG: XamI family restriction endonuclease [Holophagales bacterium]|nr:MAG: XamI family restriction endonuclease [Holophagales bacterium]
MALNADKPHLWKADIAASVDHFNRWFMRFAPKAYRTTRVQTTERVKEALLKSKDLRDLSPDLLRKHPEVLVTLRMATAPPIARDRLIGLAGTTSNLVHRMEDGNLPKRMASTELTGSLGRICKVLTELLDRDIFPWLEGGKRPTELERDRASTIVADRLCGAIADPIVRNSQEQRQLELVETFLEKRGYRRKQHGGGRPIVEMELGTFAFRLNLVVGQAKKVNIPIDVVIQPKKPRPGRMPILIEAKSAGDFTNTNKRRKEEATKIHQLRSAYGKDTQLILFLCGYFDSGYLGYEAAEGLDWVWEHRIEDLLELGL